MSTKVEDQTHAVMPVLPPRQEDSHKGDFGRALLVGGSSGMGGAISLTGRATLRSGAGLVTIAVPRLIQNLVASFEPACMTHGLPDAEGKIAGGAADEILELAGNATVVAIGPGLGRNPAITQLVAQLYRDLEKPMIVDADGLYALAETPGILAEARGPRVLTPHPGEFARFTGNVPSSELRVDAATRLAALDKNEQTVVLLKGHRTVIADGRRFSVNNTGNPGMATGGTGDVLTGIITGFMCQGLEPFDAARLGAYLHGSAGDMAAGEVGQVSLIASDIIDYLPHAVRHYESHHRRLKPGVRR